jgi:putative heme-binding domain-containing protein
MFLVAPPFRAAGAGLKPSAHIFINNSEEYSVVNQAGFANKLSGWVSSAVLAATLLAGWSARPLLLPGQQKTPPVAWKSGTDHNAEALFRVNCAGCHGLDARGGGQGPDLTSGRVARGNEAVLMRTILKGVPGTAMPANDLTESETRTVIAYIRSLGAGAHTPVTGDREKGKALFLGKGNCSSCHMVNGQGGRLGPDLSDVGASRSVEYLTESIREPSKELSQGLEQLFSQFTSPAVYDTVTVETRDGQSFIGVAKDEDNFSIQLLGVDQELHLFMKKDLKQVTHEHKSLMPPYDEQAISKAELQDLLAYLQSLHPIQARAGESKKGPQSDGPNKY